MATNKTLPEELLPFQEQLVQTRRPFIQLLPRESRKTLPWESKIGGLPYWPAQMKYPTAPDGSPLWLLAQANFEEVPALHPFPSQGLLQIFIHDDSLYGLNLDDPFDQSRFRLVYHPAIRRDDTFLLNSFGFLEDARYLPIEAGVSYPLSFQLGHELVPPSDYQFDQLLGEGFFEVFGEEQWEVRNRYSRAVLNAPHKMGGYAFFCQEDPRNPGEPMELLFQLGSSDQFNCMWGDMGVANFFICRDALQKANFSRVMYNWDCY
ncbi:MAG: DUF1963 domain-containing protein [Lewinellaceae bacterium]|nr:DUF1963 domain-containing protein [Lewinellaceae bacterium]